MEFILYSLIGTIAGFLGGLLGIGGGLVVVPALLFAFHQMHFPDTFAMQIAVGTSLGAMLFTSASSAWAHYRQKGVSWNYVLLLAPGVILGAISGAISADYLSSHRLRLIFAISVMIIGSTFILPEKQKGTTKPKNIPQNSLIMSALGFFIGALSSLLGIGGGIITVPILTAMQMPIRNAISTSAAIGFVIAFIGALTFLFLGLRHPTDSSHLGYLYLPAFIGIGLTSSLAAPYGAKLAYTWPTDILRRIFGLVLIIAGLGMM